MTLEDRLTQDLKAAMLAGQQQRVMTLRGLKSSLLYAKVAQKSPRDEPMADEAVLELFAREAKKRQESAELYTQGGSPEKAETELTEKAIIEEYLPAQLSEDEVTKLVDRAIAELEATDVSKMGQVIGKVRAEAGMTADGALIARLVRERLNNK